MTVATLQNAVTHKEIGLSLRQYDLKKINGRAVQFQESCEK